MARFLALSIVAALVIVPGHTTRTDNQDVAYWFTQRVDHFGRNDQQWEQHYMVNHTYYKAGGPIFITTPGDNALTSHHTSMTHLIRLAQQHNGIAVAIEQRFYGSSAPLPDLSASSLEYMTAENMLADFASFIREAKTNPSSVFPVAVTEDAQVVFAGSSFAANVAVWMRSTYPDLVAGAWASSAFVYNRLENYQFEQSFGYHLEQLGCGSRFAQAVRDLDYILFSNDQVLIDSALELFGLPSLSVQVFASVVSDMAMSEALAQITVNGDPVAEAVCAHFSKGTPALVSYANVVKAAIKRRGLSPAQLLSMDNYNRTDTRVSLNQPDLVSYFISCTWFSNWITATPRSSGLDSYISQLMTLDLSLSQCRRHFGHHVDFVGNVDSFNRKWFYPLHSTTNIFYTVGSLDIWRGSSVAPVSGHIIRTNSNSHIEVIEGAGHAQDFDMESVSDILSVKRARHIGDTLVKKWLGHRNRYIRIDEVE
ncbi:hypothetical protein IWW39_002795 [Coemansia spiralis]|uniref:Uncharacterized protein n=1 Tax=Coemansia spiralis TaxID=417178 RepID=A0A9W8GMD1_9FUNG|nr:hypothetical protein IWW39_002795 [Coemansia spiralis]